MATTLRHSRLFDAGSRTAILLTATVVLAIGTTASALAVNKREVDKNGNGIRFQNDFDRAFEEAKERNVPVLVGLIQDGEAENERIVTETYRNKKFIDLSRGLVVLVGSRGLSTEHGYDEQDRDGKTKRICSKFGAITCTEHQSVEVAIFREYSKNGRVDTPLHILIHPVDGRRLGEADDYISMSRLSSLVKKAQREVGRGLDDDEYFEVLAELEAAKKAMEEKQYEVALEELGKIADLQAGGTLVEGAAQLVDEIVGRGYEMLAKAAEHGEAGEFGHMHAILEVLNEEFRDVRDLYRDAKKLERTHASNPESKKAAKAIRLEPEARAELEKAQGYVDRENYSGALLTLRLLLEKYDGTPSSTEGARLLERLESDPKIQKAIAEQEEKTNCNKWLRAGREFERQGDREKARAEYQRILDQYPDSSFAKEARERLEAIQ